MRYRITVDEYIYERNPEVKCLLRELCRTQGQVRNTLAQVYSRHVDLELAPNQHAILRNGRCTLAQITAPSYYMYTNMTSGVRF